MIVVTLEVCGICGVGGTIKLKQLKQVEASWSTGPKGQSHQQGQDAKNIKEYQRILRFGLESRFRPHNSFKYQVTEKCQETMEMQRNAVSLRFHSFMFSSLHLFYLFISYSDSVHVLSISLHISFPCSFRFIPLLSFSTASTDSTSLHDPISNHWAHAAAVADRPEAQVDPEQSLAQRVIAKTHTTSLLGSNPIWFR